MPRSIDYKCAISRGNLVESWGQTTLCRQLLAFPGPKSHSRGVYAELGLEALDAELCGATGAALDDDDIAVLFDGNLHGFFDSETL